MKLYLQYVTQFNNSDLNTWINSTLYNYLKKNKEDQGEIEHILDYLAQTNKNILGMQYSVAKENTKKWTNKLIKQAGNIIETEKDVKVEIKFNNGFKLVRLLGEAAYKREGKLMSNCVASYFDQNCEIYSLRDVNNNPHCTMELSRGGTGSIEQIKGKGNGSIHPKYIAGVLQSLKYLGLKVRPSELTYLGYDDIPDYYWQFLEENFSGIKYITFQNKRYFYKYSKLVSK